MRETSKQDDGGITMKRTAFLPGIIITGILFSGGLALAQTSSTRGSSPKTYVPAAKTTPSDSLNTTMADFSKGWMTISSEFKGLEDHFNTMLKINDIKELKSALAEHQKLMNALKAQISSEQEAYQHVMTMMESGNMHSSMMGSSNGAKPMSGMMGGGTKSSMSGNKSGGK